MTLTKALRVLGATTVAGALLFSAAPVASADQVRDAQWANSYFDLEKVGSVSKGDGVVVGLIDTGVDATHPDLTGSVLKGYDTSGTGQNERPTDPHGTSMAGLIVGHGHGSDAGVVGLAPGAKVLPVYKNSASGGDAVPEGIRWAVDHNAKVINISGGSYDQPKSNAKMTEAVAYAAQHDVLIVAAAGNDGRNTVGNPANEPGVLAVGAVDKNGSSWAKSNYGPQVMISAPGAQVVSTGACEGAQYCMGDGTSGAAAYVSAAAALVRAKFPKLTAGQVANRLVKSAKSKGGKVPDPHYGYGILSPYDALTMDIPAGSAQGPLAGTSGAGTNASPSTGATTGGDSDGSGALPQAPGAMKDSSNSGLGVGVLLAIGAVVVLLVVIVVIVAVRSRRRSGPGPVPMQGQPPYGAPQGWGPGQQPYGNQAPPPGYPPQPYQQQYPPQYPQQNPYGPGGNQSQH